MMPPRPMTDLIVRYPGFKQNLVNLRRNRYAPIRRGSPWVTYETNVMHAKEPSDASPQKPLSRSCAHDLRNRAQADQGGAVSPQKFEAESPCPAGLPQCRKVG